MVEIKRSYLKKLEITRSWKTQVLVQVQEHPELITKLRLETLWHDVNQCPKKELA